MYTGKNLLHYFFACICLRKKKSLNLFESFEPHWRMQLGKEKLTRELDVIKLLRAIRDVRLLKDAQLTASESILLKFQRSRIIQTSSSSGVDEKFNYRELLEDKEPNVRIQTLAKIRNSFKELNDTKVISETQKILIRGMYITRPTSQFLEKEHDLMRQKFKDTIKLLMLHRRRQAKNSDYMAKSGTHTLLRSQTQGGFGKKSNTFREKFNSMQAGHLHSLSKSKRQQTRVIYGEVEQLHKELLDV